MPFSSVFWSRYSFSWCVDSNRRQAVAAFYALSLSATPLFSRTDTRTQLIWGLQAEAQTGRRRKREEERKRKKANSQPKSKLQSASLYVQVFSISQYLYKTPGSVLDISLCVCVCARQENTNKPRSLSGEFLIINRRRGLRLEQITDSEKCLQRREKLHHSVITFNMFPLPAKKHRAMLGVSSVAFSESRAMTDRLDKG